MWEGVRIGKRWWKGESVTEERMGGGRRGWKGWARVDESGMKGVDNIKRKECG